jgi:translation initiation factor IF-3
LQQKILINNAIRSLKLRVIDQNGNSLGVITKEEALEFTRKAGLDLIEVSPNAEPPVAKIMDYGKYQYETSKKAKDVKAKAVNNETKNIQISIGISEHDIETKTKQAAEWLNEGHRVKVEMQLKGRNKFMDEAFLKERLNRMLAIIPAQYKIADPLKKMPKGMTIVLEKSK